MAVTPVPPQRCILEGYELPWKGSRFWEAKFVTKYSSGWAFAQASVLCWASKTVSRSAYSAA